MKDALMLYELVYSSLPLTPEADQETLAGLLDTARHNNQRMDITGVLVYHKGEFLQLLEGEMQTVQRLFYEVISRDQRHRGAHVYWEGPIAARNFRRWRMGFARQEDIDAGLPGAEGFIACGVAGLDLASPASVGRKLLLSIYTSMLGRD